MNKKIFTALEKTLIREKTKDLMKELVFGRKLVLRNFKMERKSRNIFFINQKKCELFLKNNFARNIKMKN